MAAENTLAEPGEYDALPKLREGEPYFALIGRDRLAPPLIMDWADRNRRRALDDHDHGRIDDDMLGEELRKSTNAEMLAADMKAYKAGWKAAERDPPRAGANDSYSGHELPAETQRRDQLQRLRIKIAQHLSSGGSELTQLAQELRDLDEPSLASALGAIEAKALSMMRLAGLIRPHRPHID